MRTEEEIRKLREDLQEREQREKIHDIWKVQFETFCGGEDPDPQQIRLFWNYVGWCGVNGYIDPEDFEDTGFKEQALEQVRLCVQKTDGSRTQVESILCDLIPFLENHWGDELNNVLPGDNDDS